MKKTAIVILAIVGLLAVCFLWGVGINNKLVNTEENVSSAPASNDPQGGDAK